MAIGLHATGALGKLYSEVNENIDMRPLEGVKASGGTWFDQIRYGAVPQVLPNIISYTLLRFEINVRASSIIGYVGAGGLGQEFREALSLQEYTDLSALFMIIFVTVIVIDYRLGKAAPSDHRHGKRPCVMTPTPEQIRRPQCQRHPRAFRDPPVVRARKIALWAGVHRAVCLVPL